MYSNQEPLWFPGRTSPEAVEAPVPALTVAGCASTPTERCPVLGPVPRLCPAPAPGGRKQGFTSRACHRPHASLRPGLPPAAESQCRRSLPAPGRTPLRQRQPRTTAGPAKDRRRRSRREETKGRAPREDKDVRRDEGTRRWPGRPKGVSTCPAGALSSVSPPPPPHRKVPTPP